jgi:small neutral amino acid transporter SnatA (MarC family)
MEIFIILGGIFCIVCSFKNYDWFFKLAKAEVFVKLFGREGARLFYLILGFLIMFLGIFQSLR